MPTHYDILGVSPDAGHSEIQQAAKAQVAELKSRLGHDAKTDATVRAQARQIKAALLVLNDPAKRQAYDAGLQKPANTRSEDHDPYQTPQANLQTEYQQGIGGNLEDAVSGNYVLNMREILREAWERTSGLKGAIWMATVLLWLLSAAFGAILQTLILTVPGMTGNVGIAITYGLQIVFNIVTYPIAAGMIMLGIRRAVDLSVAGTMAFRYFRYILPLFVANILMLIFIAALLAPAILLMEMTYFASLILILPALYLGFAYIFILPLIVEKRLSIWKALETSRQAVTSHWFRIFGIYLVMGLLTMLSVIPLGIGLIWTVPMMFALQGVLYRIIFGVTNPGED